MSLIISVIVDDHKGNKDIIFASDGRAIEHGTNNIRSEDYEKVKKLRYKICLGYVGHSAEFFIDIFDELNKKIKNMSLINFTIISNRLRQIIIEKLKSKQYLKIEELYGHLNHQFVLGGIFSEEITMASLLSSNEFQITKQDVLNNHNIAIDILGSSDRVQLLAAALCKDMLGYRQTSDEIANKLRFIISKMAEQTPEINNHIFVRKLSSKFEIENYIGC